MGIKGFATAEGTQRFRSRFTQNPAVCNEHFRELINGLVLGSVGMGTYLGNPDAEDDALMMEAVVQSVKDGGLNVIDTAINYRAMNSERAVGQAIKALYKDQIHRDELFIATKNGFLTPDANKEEPFQEYFQREFIDTGIVDPKDIVGGMHCMTPAYLENQLEQSLSNLGLETIDLMYLHNAAESQLPIIGKDAFMDGLEKAFSFYEDARRAGKIKYYGLATWNCFRVPENHPEHLSIQEVFQIAHNISGESHGFRFIQLPYNLAMTEALTQPTQNFNGEALTAFETALAYGIGVFTSVPLLQGQLLGHDLPDFEGLETPAQSCLQFVRSHPGVVAPLVGHKQPKHVEENLKISAVAPLPFEALQEKLAQKTT